MQAPLGQELISFSLCPHIHKGPTQPLAHSKHAMPGSRSNDECVRKLSFPLRKGETPLAQPDCTCVPGQAPSGGAKAQRASQACERPEASVGFRDQPQLTAGIWED